MTGTEARPPLGTWDGIALVVGVVVGAGIFRVPSDVAAGTDGPGQFVAVWLMGGVAALCGALCYARLMTAWPSSGGEYHFLRHGMGRVAGYLFIWSRALVIQTGAIAAIAFVLDDYARTVLALPAGLAAFAALAALTATNAWGWQPGRWAQRLFTTLTLAAYLAVCASALAAPEAAEGPPPPPAPTSPGLALVFVMLAYGGWSEAAYLGGEIRRGRAQAMRVVAGGVAVVVVLYLLLNLALLEALGLAAMRSEDAVAAAAVERAFGPLGKLAVGGAVILACLSTLNATLVTGSRSIEALGRDLPALRALAVPRGALTAQAAWAALLLAGGLMARDGFEAMIRFTAPVFWGFLLLVGVVALRHSAREWAVAPALIFCASSAYMVQASIAHAGTSGGIGLALLVLGLPFALWATRRSAP